MNRELDESLNNSYLIKRRLAGLRKYPGSACYRLSVGHFDIRMFTNAEYSNPKNKELSSIIDYKSITVEIWESVDAIDVAIGTRRMVNLWKDYRFADIWEELRWTQDDYEWKHGILVPLPIVCDLIRHVDRIVELIPFH